MYLDLIHRHKKITSPLNLSVELFGCLYHPMPLHYFFFWLSTDTPIRFLAVHRILRWIIIDCSCIFKNPCVLPLTRVGLVESYPLLWPQYSTFKDVPLTFDVCRMDSLKFP